MRKLTKKLFISVMTLVLTAMALGTSTFAWFSMNTTVTSTGMRVKTQVNNNLLIAPANASGDADFKTNFVTEINAILEPVSTIDGQAYFYTENSNVQGSGAATTDTFVAYVAGDAFDANYGMTSGNSQADCYGYKDYNFKLKATNTNASSAAYVNLTGLNLVYGGAQSTVEHAFRVAVLVKDLGTSLSNSVENYTLVSILKDSSAQYFSYAVDQTSKGVSATNAKAAVTNLGADAIIGTVAASTTKYFDVVIRLWLEGEDTTCNTTTFANLSDSWALDLTIELEDADTNAITELTKTVTADKINLASDTASATTVVVDGVTYYRLTTNTGYYTLDSTFASTSRVFTITDGHVVEVTNKCTLPAPANNG